MVTPVVASSHRATARAANTVGQVALAWVLQMVVDRSGFQIGLAHPERFLDVP